MHPPLPKNTLTLLTISLSLAIFMNVLDTSIANVSIPSIAGDLGVSPNEGTWVITSFAVSMAIALPLSGWLAKRFGEVRLFVGSVILFTVASLLCGLSENLQMLLFFRVVQGAVAGPMIPLSQSLLLSNYPDEKKGLATAFWAMTAVLAPIFGPILGGWITDNYTWPWIFYINLPVGIISAFLTWNILRERETEIVKLPVDTVGLVLLIIGIGSLQIMLDKGNDLDWFHSSFIVTLCAIAVIALSFFIVWELTEKHPVVDLTLFKQINFTIGTVAIALGYLAFFGGVVVFPLWLQTQMGYTPTWAGFAAAPIGVFSFILSPFVGKFMHRMDLRILVSFSFLVFAWVSFWNSTFNTDTSFTALVIPRLVQGIAMSCFFIPLLSVLLSGLPANRVASAAGLSNFLRIVAGSFGTSISITLWSRRESFHHSHLVEHINLYNPASQQTLNTLHDVGLNQTASYQLLANTITNQAYMLSTNDIFWLSGWLFLCLLALIWFAKPPFMGSNNNAGGGAH